jgi:ATP-binding cassette subfamily F protein 3
VLELKQARKAYGDLVVFNDLGVHIERGDRIALVGPNGVGKSTLMRMLSGEEAPDSGVRVEGHNVVTQYFAQDEATRIDPAPTVYEILASGSATNVVPAIRNILGGFLFSGDDVYKRVGVLSGGERTRLAVARMLLRPSNTLLLDEPTNHLDLDSKEVLLDALIAYGGTLVFVSHDRYFVERLATKIIEVGNGTALMYPGTYAEFLWHKEHPAGAGLDGQERQARQAGPGVRDGNRKQEHAGRTIAGYTAAGGSPRDKKKDGARSREEQKRVDAESRRRARAEQTRRSRIDQLETRIADTERAIREIEQTMGAPGFYDDRTTARTIIDRHQALMWEVGDLMHQWEELQTTSELTPAADR